MGRERNARLERREIKQELLAMRRQRRRNLWPLLVVLLLAIAGGSALGYYARDDRSDDRSDETNLSTITEEGTMLNATIKTDKGDIAVELFSDAAPKTVENFAKLAREKFYDGTKFHRVIEDFVIQGGDPNSKDDDPSNDGAGGPGYEFEDEINPRSLGLSDDAIAQLESDGYVYNFDLESHKMEPGSLAMANSGPATNGSQFYVVT
ncbi:MAG: peptidylprolyl isomerase, partial [bacterium]|nr:peptidylprolyl isomerase [bacterium]